MTTGTQEITAKLKEIGTQEISNAETWLFIEAAAATLLPEYTLVSWDGIKDGIFQTADEDADAPVYTLLVHTLADVKAVLADNSILA